MIEYVDNWEDVEWNDVDANAPIMISAYDQCWNKETLKELKEKYNIFFMSNNMDSMHPIMIRDEICYIGHEDDGTIYFNRKYGKPTGGFSIYWIDSLINELTTVKNFIENKED